MVRRFQADLQGTNLLDPLKWVMEKDSVFNERYIIVVTDGHVNNTEEVISFCDTRRKENTIYAFGVGPDADKKLVTGVADGGLGLMTNPTDLEIKVKLAMDAVLSDFYHNIEVKFQMPQGYSVSQLDSPKVLIPGEKLVVFATIKYLGRELRRAREEEENVVDIEDIEKGECIVTFTDPDCDKQTLKANFKLVVHQKWYSLLAHLDGNHLLLNELLNFVELGLPIHRLAAKRNILAWSLEREKESEMKALSIETNVLSPVTAFVAVIDGENVVAEGKKAALDIPPRLSINAHRVDYPKSVRPELCFLDGDDDDTSSSWSFKLEDGETGLECYKVSSAVVSSQPGGPKKNNMTNIENQGNSKTDDVGEFEIFTMMYKSCFSRLQKKYSTAVKLVSAVDMHLEAVKQGIDQDDWASFIRKRLITIGILVSYDGTEYEMKVNAYGSVDDLISSICRELSVTKDEIGVMKFGIELLIPGQNNKTLVELGFRNGLKLFVDKQMTIIRYISI